MTPGGLGELVQTQLSAPQQTQTPQTFLTLSSRLQCVEVVRMSDGKHFLCMGSDAQVDYPHVWMSLSSTL